MCTHNPRDAYISRAIGALQRQTLERDQWELIVVDNASAKPLGERLEIDWHSAARVVREEELGLTHARLRGIRESVGDVIVFVDDDNILDEDYLAAVDRIARSHEFLGSWSGNVSPEFEVPPPEWTRRYWGNLVIREVARDAWSNLYGIEATTPLGAGLCVRRPVANEYLRLHDQGLRPRVLDRAGKSLVSGGDNDLAACALDIGLACGVMTSQRLTHLIPEERLSEDYLLRLIEGVAYSGIILKSLRPETSGKIPDRGLIGRAADIARRLRMSPRERRFHDAVMRGEARARNQLEQV
jgi:Glycosyltransferases involved in cell wall biogenesis